MLPEYSRPPLARTLFALLGGTMLSYDALQTAAAPSSQRIGRTWVGAHLNSLIVCCFAVFHVPSRSDEDGNHRAWWNWSDTICQRTHWTEAEPLNELYSLRVFSLLNLGPHSETTGALNTTNQTVSTRTGGEVTGPRWLEWCGSGPECASTTASCWLSLGPFNVVGDTREHSGLQDRCSRSTGKPGSRYPCCGSLCGTHHSGSLEVVLLLARVQN
ncbi:hypothetical protein B0T20DRAFT_455065 [Sordaria brevicollis]|uniref:Uncharacterized protein n=1 Tax=Sordaria brevicollis TaxID=83679 RepID=A0AAE0PAW5_SORBR|nr:hypothetical protein B0T20DRAFT_455065 [Sordaria brevicollis]